MYAPTICLGPSLSAKYQLNYHDVRTLHYLSQGMEPAETVPQLQSRFEAWKVPSFLLCFSSFSLTYAPCFFPLLSFLSPFCPLCSSLLILFPPLCYLLISSLVSSLHSPLFSSSLPSFHAVSLSSKQLACMSVDSV